MKLLRAHHHTPPISTPVTTMSGRHAFLCLDLACQAISSRAPHGRCEVCQQTCIISIQKLAHVYRWVVEAVSEKKAKEKPAERELMQAINENVALFLTSPDKRVA